MKTFREFMTEVYDPEVQGRSQIRKTGEGGRVGADRRKSEPEKRRVKATGGGQTVPAKSYKDRKDIGTQKQRSTKEQQPQKERGTAGLSFRDQQRKAAMERRARKSGAKTPTASQLLTKKSAKKVSPDYKPQKASGKTAAERKAAMKKGERTLRDIQLKNLGKKSEKELKNPITQKEITRRNKAK